MKNQRSTYINNLRELAEYLGADDHTPEKINRRLYKDTSAGAHISFAFPDKPARTTEHRAEIRLDPATGLVRLEKLTPDDVDVRILLGFNAAGTPFVDPDMPPPEFYRSVETYEAMARRFMAEQGDVKEGLSEIRRCIGCLRITVTKHVPASLLWIHNGQTLPERLVLDTCLGFQLGAIVEGSDYEVNPAPLFFPVPAKKLDDTIAYVEAEVDFALQDNARN